jgi:hypothetical protein
MKFLFIFLIIMGQVFAGDMYLVCEDENFDPVATQILSTNDANNSSAVVEFNKNEKNYRIAYLDGTYQIEIIDLVSTKLTSLTIKAAGDTKELGQIDNFHCMILD